MEPIHFIIMIFLLVIQKIKAWMLVSEKPRLECYCPGCREDLVSSENTQVVINEDDDQLISYLCGSCETISHWFFGTPLPILLGGKHKDGTPTVGCTSIRKRKSSSESD